MASFWLSTPTARRCRCRSASPASTTPVNAAGATAALHAAGAEIADAVAALSDFRGAGRRYELRGSRDGYTVVDDYAHHPTEVKAVIAAARTQAPRRLVVSSSPTCTRARVRLRTSSERRSAAPTRRS